MSEQNPAGLVIGIAFGYPSVHRRFARSMAFVANPMNLTKRIMFVDDQPLDKARIMIAEEALKENAKYVLFWDDDVEAPSWCVRYLLATIEQYSDVGIVGGIYPARSVPCEPCVFAADGQGPFWQWKAGSIFECASLGLGMSIFRTEVLKKIPKPWFAFVDEATSDPNNLEKMFYVDDSVYFCKKVRAAGYRILAHGGVLCNHCDRKTGAVYALPEDSYPFQK